MKKVAFAVIGDPAAQGSKTPAINKKTGKPFMMEGQTKEAREKFKSWRSLVREAAAERFDDVGQFHDGPISVEVDYFFAIPKGRIRKSVIATPIIMRWKWKAPDVDKLARAVLDALTQSGLIKDDSRVCVLTVRKYEVVGRLGARIVVSEMEDPEAL